MAKDRLTPCKYYICKGCCTKVRKAEHTGYCQNVINIIHVLKFDI